MSQEQLYSAMRSAQSGDLDGAEATCRRLLREAPEDPDALQLLGLVLKQKGDDDRAIRYMRRSLKSKPDQPNVLNNLGNLLLNSGDAEGAISHYRAAVKAAPDYTDARLNLAVAEAQLGETDAALAAVEEVLADDPGNMKGIGLKGRFLKMQGREGEALPLLVQAAKASPENFEIQLSLGQTLRLAGRPEEAIACYQTCLKLRPRSAETYFHYGHALYDLDQTDAALDSYRYAISIQPDYREAHELLNKLCWEHGRSDDFLKSYRNSIERAPTAVGLYVDYAKYLSLTGASEDALKVLEDAERNAGESGSISWAKARALAERREWDKCYAEFDRAIELSPGEIVCLHDYARVLILRGDYKKALELVLRSRPLAPLDQQTFAYEWLCQKLLGDSHADYLYDYENFVQGENIECPPGYENLAAFNRDLATYLRARHRTEYHPIDQTLRGGTQTHGILFEDPAPVIQAVKGELERAVKRFIAKLPDDSEHPFLSRKTGKFAFSGSWSVRLAPGGHHINHVHSRGWISSAYYVELPPGLGGEGKEGWLKFGESDLNLGDRERPAKYIEPAVGKLALFPSYMYHGTVPFQGDSPRMTIAFDVIPD